MSEAPENPSGLVAFDVWIKELNKTPATGWRWRKRFPWLKIVNIFGKNYISRQMIAEFERRAMAGEFARDAHPQNGKAVH